MCNGTPYRIEQQRYPGLQITQDVWGFLKLWIFYCITSACPVEEGETVGAW